MPEASFFIRMVPILSIAFHRIIFFQILDYHTVRVVLELCGAQAPVFIVGWVWKFCDWYFHYALKTIVFCVFHYLFNIIGTGFSVPGRSILRIEKDPAEISLHRILFFHLTFFQHSG